MTAKKETAPTESNKRYMLMAGGSPLTHGNHTGYTAGSSYLFNTKSAALDYAAMIIKSYPIITVLETVTLVKTTTPPVVTEEIK